MHVIESHIKKLKQTDLATSLRWGIVTIVYNAAATLSC